MPSLCVRTLPVPPGTAPSLPGQGGRPEGWQAHRRVEVGYGILKGIGVQGENSTGKSVSRRPAAGRWLGTPKLTWQGLLWDSSIYSSTMGSRWAWTPSEFSLSFRHKIHNPTAQVQEVLPVLEAVI